MANYPTTTLGCLPALGWNSWNTFTWDINEALISNDTIMAIEQCVASNKCLNFRDSAVCSVFMSTMYENSSEGYSLRFIELPDGKVVKPSEAVKWLNEQEEEKKDE